LENRNLSREVAQLRRELEGDGRIDLLVGKSPAMQAAYKVIGAVAGSDCAVLIRGESGTGKELAARAIHAHSERRNGPFVALNCAAVPETLLESELYGHVRGAFTGAVRDRAGKAELADRGTLFLDEIGDMPGSIQAKLLRFLELKRFERVGATESLEADVRILAATHQDPRELIERGKFREDLYWRLNVVTLELPPLRSRRDDIPLLVAHFLSRPAERVGVTPPEIDHDIPELLRRYDWPGNVRELKNAVEHAAILARGGNVIREEHLPAHILQALRGGGELRRSAGLEAQLRARSEKALDAAEKLPMGAAYNEIVSEVEKVLLTAALERAKGNQVQAARLLGVHRTTLRKKIDEYGLGDCS
jgi:two-component system nitrogen regulation response regulator GlnG